MRARIAIARSRRIVTASVLIALAAPMLSGCYRDTASSENMVVGDKGDLERPKDITPDTTAPAAKAADAKPSPSTPTADDFGLPFYPDAQPRMGLDGMPKSRKLPDGGAVAVLQTRDPRIKVLNYYKRHMRHATELTETVDGDQARTLSEPWQHNGLHSVAVLDRGDFTEIQLTSVPGDKSVKEPSSKEVMTDLGLADTDPRQGRPPKGKSTAQVGPASGTALKYAPAPRPTLDLPPTTADPNKPEPIPASEPR